jgi:chromosome segregation ATPase
MDWPIALGFAILVVVSVTLWGAMQGWFSSKIKVNRPRDSVDVDLCEPYKRRIAELENRIFDLENLLANRDARIKDLERTIQKLMADIARLTEDLAKCQASEADLRNKLKIALDELSACRAALRECRAQLLAKKVSDAVCKLQPENANLLR